MACDDRLAPINLRGASFDSVNRGRFNSGHEPASRVVDISESLRGGAAESESAIDRYCRGGLKLELTCRIHTDTQVSQLATGRSPFISADKHDIVHDSVADPVSRADSGGGEYFVGVAVPDFVHGPKGAISSLVRFAGYDELQNLSMEILALSLIDFGFELLGGVTEGKLAPLGVLFPGSEFRAGVKGVIQGVSRVPKYIVSPHCELGGDIGFEDDLAYLLASLRIDIYTMGPIIWANEGLGERVECADVFFRLLKD
ncbi:hypothetical protein [Brevundimonas sp. EAKA]|uniref:hypothetical protein n=1 Tax=Brevundimonas sp. EAKA TaxID=1495854 RepID=UPI0012DDF7E8|nr:hypothetical protein [Brevundimonas sp. EAKA]